MSRYKRHKTIVYTAYPKLELLEKHQSNLFSAVQTFKKHRDESLLALFGMELARLIEKRYGRNFDAITCPPIKLKRIRQGYSPAAELGKRVSSYLGIDFVSFFRNGSGIYNERYRTASKRFKEGRQYVPELKISPQGLKILLVDDVTVTNQTLTICCDSLYLKGASLVRCAVLVG